MTTVNDNRLRVAYSDQIPEGGRLVISVRGMEVGIFRLEGGLRAYENRCPHAGGPVCQGTILHGIEEVLDEERRSLGQTWNEGDPRIICPWHGYEFSLRTGEFPNLPHLKLRPVPVVEADGEVFLGD